MLNRVLYVLGGFVPCVGAYAFGWVHAHGQRLLSVGQIDTRRIPNEDRRCAPDDVAAVVHVEVPGEGSVLLWSAGWIAYFGRGADVDGLVAVSCFFETGYLFCGEYV